MVELLSDFPSHVAAYRASGNVDQSEYERVVMARVREVAQKFGKINFLVRLETDFENYSLRSFLKYLKISFGNFSRWQRMAIVTDERWVRMAYDLLSPLVHGEVRGYTLAEFNKAKQWVSGPSETNHADAGLPAMLCSAMVATTGMTLVSEALGRLEKENFNEAELLGFLMRQGKPRPGERIAGWAVHYAIGVGWTAVYILLIRKRLIDRSTLTSLGIGALSGAIAAGCWAAMLGLSPKEPSVNKEKFLMQLVPSHVVFGFVALKMLR
jgi:hypothetical protein